MQDKAPKHTKETQHGVKHVTPGVKSGCFALLVSLWLQLQSSFTIQLSPAVSYTPHLIYTGQFSALKFYPNLNKGLSSLQRSDPLHTGCLSSALQPVSKSVLLQQWRTASPAAVPAHGWQPQWASYSTPSSFWQRPFFLHCAALSSTHLLLSTATVHVCFPLILTPTLQVSQPYFTSLQRTKDGESHSNLNPKFQGGNHPLNMEDIVVERDKGPPQWSGR